MTAVIRIDCVCGKHRLYDIGGNTSNKALPEVRDLLFVEECYWCVKAFRNGAL